MTEPLDAAVARLEGDFSDARSRERHLAQVYPDDLRLILDALATVRAERDYYEGECRNAKAYWNIETKHAEAAEAQATSLKGLVEEIGALCLKAQQGAHSRTWIADDIAALLRARTVVGDEGVAE